jgi:uncharacterized protein (TIGR02452 family)
MRMAHDASFHPLSLTRDGARRLGQETLDIVEAGYYDAPSGTRVSIGQAVQRAVRGTVAYPPEACVAPVHAGTQCTQVNVTNESTLQAAARLVRGGARAQALNFASATHPGGGFLQGARAQEESLCRASGLYPSLKDQPMYPFHWTSPDPLHTDYVLYSPDVPVFRSDDGVRLEAPYLCSFLTCAAVNAKVLLERQPWRSNEINPTMARRIDRMLAVASLHPHDALILGAWGCGAFGNDPHKIAALFQTALTGRFRGVFPHIVFAITDHWQDGRNITPFQQAFPEGGS